MRRPALLAGLLAACGTGRGAPVRPPVQRPPVLVTIVIDQLPAWVVAEKVDRLPDSGGFARLRREGTWVREMHYAHAITHTGPGHAALYTGQPPRESGVTIDTVLLPDGEEVSSYRSNEVHPVTPDGVGTGPGISPARLQPTGIADWLRAAEPRAFIVSLSLKDRGAVLAAGRAADVALWFDPAARSFVTSTVYAERFPEWARPLADRDAIAAASSQPWQPLDAGWIAARAATPDAQPGEASDEGLGISFPHRARTPKAFRATPFADAVLFALARRALEQAPRDQPILLALSLSANDYIGHAFGPDSWESWDELARLDAALASFMKDLDRRFGPDGWALMLTADHGVAPLPETVGKTRRPWCASRAPDHWQRACGRCSRLLRQDLSRRLEESASALLGKGPWIAGIIEPYVILSDAARNLPAEPRGRLVTALLRQIEEEPAVARALDISQLAGQPPRRDDESLDALLFRSVFPAGPGDIYIVTRPCSFFDPDTTEPGRGANHGSPYLYDRAVALFVRAPARVAAGRVIDRPLRFTTFSRTAAALLGIEGAGDDGADLTQR